jgi:hypothetical protein
MNTKAALEFTNNFNLKNVAVDLRRGSHSINGPFISIRELESMRTESRTVTASKYGLEAICGASCETGAQ